MSWSVLALEEVLVLTYRYRQVPPDVFRANLSSILDIVASPSEKGKIESSPPPYILLLGPTPVTERAFHNNRAKEEYSAIISQVAQHACYSSKVDYIDLYQLFNHAADPVADLLDSDGLHISPRGYEVSRLRARW